MDMANGGYGKRRVVERKPTVGHRSKRLGIEKKPKQKPKSVSIKYQICSAERMLRKVMLTLQQEAIANVPNQTPTPEEIVL